MSCSFKKKKFHVLLQLQYTKSYIMIQLLAAAAGSVSAKDVDVHGELAVVLAAAAAERLEQAQVALPQRVVVDKLLPPAAELVHLALVPDLQLSLPAAAHAGPPQPHRLPHPREVLHGEVLVEALHFFHPG